VPREIASAPSVATRRKIEELVQGAIGEMRESPERRAVSLGPPGNKTAGLPSRGDPPAFVIGGIAGAIEDEKIRNAPASWLSHKFAFKALEKNFRRFFFRQFEPAQLRQFQHAQLAQYLRQVFGRLLTDQAEVALVEDPGAQGRRQRAWLVGRDAHEEDAAAWPRHERGRRREDPCAFGVGISRGGLAKFEEVSRDHCLLDGVLHFRLKLRGVIGKMLEALQHGMRNGALRTGT
jgi:hypothetical protein